MRDGVTEDQHRDAVFVVGAGASAEAKLPIGSTLTSTIGSLLNFSIDRTGRRTDGDGQIYDALVSHFARGEPLKSHERAARQIHAAMPLPQSIDEYIDSRRDPYITTCGKLAIAKAILLSERGSRLRQPDGQLRLDHGTIRDTWFNRFWKCFSSGGCTLEELPKRASSILFIVFNYDRCIEHFLHEAICRHYDLPDEKAAKIVEKFQFYHPYGSLGPLPWMRERDALGFGADVDPETLFKAAQLIKTFTETRVETDPDLQQALTSLHTATRIIFLGFGFHRQNMQLLWPQIVPPRLAGEVLLFATTKDISAYNREQIAHELYTVCGLPRETHRLFDGTCYDFFHEYSSALEFSIVA
jgi:hypothetical protein